MSFPSMHHEAHTRGPRPRRSRLEWVLEGMAWAIAAPFIAGVVLAFAFALVRGSVRIEIVGDSRFVAGGMLLWGAVASLLSYFVSDAQNTQRLVIRELLDRTARRLGGQPCFDPARRVAWVDRHWLGDLTALDLHASACGGMITLVAHVYPVLVVIDPLPVHVVLDTRRAKQRRPPRIEVFLAAVVSGDGTHASAHVAQARHWLASQGFELIVSEAGLRARATAPRLETLRRNLTTFAEIDQAVHALVCLAASLRAEPVAPIP